MGSDPTGGAGYGFGAQLPSAHMTTIATQQPDLVDGGTPVGIVYPANISFSGIHTHTGQIVGTTTGGTLDMSATALTIGDNGVDVNLTGLLDLSSDYSGIAYRLGVLADADANLTVAVDRYRFIATPTIPRTYTLLDVSAPVPEDGQEIEVTMTMSSAVADAIFVRETGTVEIARIVGSNNGGTLKFTYHAAGNGWYVSGNGGDGQITLHS